MICPKTNHECDQGCDMAMCARLFGVDERPGGARRTFRQGVEENWDDLADAIKDANKRSMIPLPQKGTDG
jgi:hypothetical protein